jgi:hypothetical protein
LDIEFRPPSCFLERLISGPDIGLLRLWRPSFFSRMTDIRSGYRNKDGRQSCLDIKYPVIGKNGRSITKLVWISDPDCNGLAYDSDAIFECCKQSFGGVGSYPTAATNKKNNVSLLHLV